MKRHELIFGLIATIATAQVASAQTTETPTTAEAGQDNGDSVGVGDIVVTAQRRQENLQRVPITVATMDPQTLTTGNVDGTLQLQRTVPGLVGIRIGASFQPFIRGVGTNQTAQGSESSVATYVDGVYQGFKAGNLLDFTGIERVEVLKGPQGTLFGRNATGGAISIITRRPSQNLAVEAEIGYGSFNEKRAKLYVTGGITENLAASIAYGGRTSDGYITDVVRDKPAAPFRNHAVMVKLLWEPVEGWESTLSGGYALFDDPTGTASHIRRGTTPVNPTGRYYTYDDDESTTSAVNNLALVENYRVTWDNRYELGSLDFVSITAYIDSHLENFTDSDASPASFSHIRTSQFAKQFTQEFQVQSNRNEKFSWIVGGFYMWYRDAYGDRGDNNWSSQANLPNPVRPADLLIAGQTITGRSTGVTTESLSGFGEVKIELFDNTHLTGGIRYTTETKALKGTQYSYTAVTGPVENNFGLSNGVLGNDGLIFGRNITGTVDLSKRFDKVTWRAVLDHQFTPDIMMYASVSRGFKSGGFNPSSVTNNQTPIFPEIVTAYEVGFKSVLLDRRLRFNVSGFYNDLQDIQVAFSTSQSFTQNAGAARMYGVDVDIEAVPVEGLTLRASGSYLDAKYTAFPGASISLPRVSGATCTARTLTYAEAQAIAAMPQTGGTCQSYLLDAKGQDVIYSPKFTMNLSANYDIGLPDGSSFNLGASYYYNSGFNFTAGGFFTATGAFDTLALSVGWTSSDDRFYLRIFGDNVTNNRYPRIILPSPVTFTTVTSAPTTFGITAGFKFGN